MLNIHSGCSEREDGARELSHCQTPCSPSCPQEALSQLPPTSLGRFGPRRATATPPPRERALPSRLLVVTPLLELMLTLAPAPVGSKRGSVRPCSPPAALGTSQPHYLDKHFLLVHGSHHFSHVGALLLQQLQLLPQQAHCRERDLSTHTQTSCPQTEGQILARVASSPAGRTSHRAPGEEDERSQAVPLAFNSFLCACRRRRFWLFSFTMSCWEKSFAEFFTSHAALASTKRGDQHNGLLCLGTGTWRGAPFPAGRGQPSPAAKGWPTPPTHIAVLSACRTETHLVHPRRSKVGSCL